MADENKDVLLIGPPKPVIVNGLAPVFNLLKFPEGKDSETFFADTAPRVRGIAVTATLERIDGAYMSRFPRLEIVSSFGVGYDHVDAAWAGAHGIIVTNTPDVLTDEVADLAIGLLLATVRQLPQGDRYLREGKWLKGAYPLSPTLRDRTVGILGLGRIGKAIAKRIEAFGIPVHYHTRTRQSDVPYPYHATLTDLAKAVDVLIVITPGGASTHHMVNADVLKALGPNGILVNVARGSVVDEHALIEALRAKTILSAGLDVFEDEPRVPQELIEMEHVVLLPHLGSASVYTRKAMGQLVVDNLVSWFDGKGPLTPVPETPYKGGAA
jgi:lactate dehydrogenase-like 2-hydroxyacid dehydrogenase